MTLGNECIHITKIGLLLYCSRKKEYLQKTRWKVKGIKIEEKLVEQQEMYKYIKATSTRVIQGI